MEGFAGEKNRLKIAAFGATGPTGKEVVAQALEEGDEVVSVAETLRASDLDWTILRITMLNNKEGPERSGRATWARGRWRHRSSRAQTSRASSSNACMSAST